ncbi:AbrB/MazE/SpoVT family DNA-binding domain-containing protein [Xaviernesmea oryzae]|jgi:looped-hinge helix DNA binding domain, AbrB family|uniref:Looped-hinge helix DNA binding domain-containing protein, AbrB family n=1 Tax=Xaviernesmea oryzae TaxID=464029 RepID=A0A1X7DP03_9HYPH|nr:AbrB/MazE/SpoVT family DNA-binding domain-containing protein [Xaviernesmea oryzae]SMF18920.1 looped-hinge helix DNA binding domain-containing protein, AbrB family [Xaviernesmea oryzae]
MSTTVTAKGQVTIPKAVRNLLGIVPGTQIEFERADDGNVIIKRADGKKPTGRFAKFRGHAGPGMNTDELMNLLRGDD